MAIKNTFKKIIVWMMMLCLAANILTVNGNAAPHSMSALTMPINASIDIMPNMSNIPLNNARQTHELTNNYKCVKILK